MADKKDEKAKQKKDERAPLVDPWSILLHPLLTEKAIGKIESENKLVFIVNRNSDKKQIKWAIERAFSVKVDNVTTLLDRKGRKKAWIKLSKEYSASDIATRLGML
jgi:large subunit ribosomal protein L23